LDPPYTWPGEIVCANAMERVASQTKASFVFALGDNFYSTGIQGNSANFRFKATFEDVYTGPSLQVPWYIVAGNHDHIGNVTAQVEYSKLSKRWNFPSLNYTFTHEVAAEAGGKGFRVQFIMFDTVVAAGMSMMDEATGQSVTEPAADAVRASEQFAWIEKELSESKAEYVWVGGHYPVWSACSHGNTDALVRRLKPLLEKYNATGYMSGHDHCMEYFDEGKGPVYVVSGSGEGCCYADSNRKGIPQGSMKYLKAGSNIGTTQSAFALFEVNEKYTEVTYIDQATNVLFKSSKILPRVL
jgi:tartrate-resistant acid phosphatase type 5